MSSSYSSQQGQGLLIPRRYIPTIANISAIINILPAAVGIYGLFRPDIALTALEFPSATNPFDANLVAGLTRMYAVRQFAFGMGGLCMWANGAYAAMGWTSIAAGLAVAVVDGLVANEVAGKVVWGHWVGVPLSLFFGGALTGWL